MVVILRVKLVVTASVYFFKLVQYAALVKVDTEG